MNATLRAKPEAPEQPGLMLIEMPWGFRLRPADMTVSLRDTLTELALTCAGVTLIVIGLAQWLTPGSIYAGDMVQMKFVLTAVLCLAGAAILNVSGRGFRPEVQVDRDRNEIRFLSRNPRGRGQVLATVDLDEIIGVGVTRALNGRECHCLIYMIDGKKPLRVASGSEREVRALKERLGSFVTPPAERAHVKARKPAVPADAA